MTRPVKDLVPVRKSSIELDAQIEPKFRKHLRDDVYQILWRQIVHGKIEPGSSIVEEDIASQLGVSRTPVREALQRLEYEGLVAPGPNSRPRVAPPTPTDIEEIYPLIGALERLAVRLAIPNLSDDDLRLMGQLTDAMAAHASRGEIEELMKVDGRFHGILYERSRNRRLQRIVSELRRQMERFEYAFFSSPEQLKASLKRHRELARILKRRDSLLAQRTVEANWECGRLSLLEFSGVTDQPEGMSPQLRKDAGPRRVGRTRGKSHHR